VREASYQDADGRWWMVNLPDGVPDADARMGIPIGPPPLGKLRLPLETEVRLHNQLFSRRIFRAKDAMNKRHEVFAALQSAYKTDTSAIVDLYIQGEAVVEDVRDVIAAREQKVAVVKELRKRGR